MKMLHVLRVMLRSLVAMTFLGALALQTVLKQALYGQAGEWMRHGTPLRFPDTPEHARMSDYMLILLGACLLLVAIEVAIEWWTCRRNGHEPWWNSQDDCPS